VCSSDLGLAATLWSENINLALDIAPKLVAGIVWINATNLFDAAAGFGGVRESGFGREGGREGMMEYLTPTWLSKAKMSPSPEAVNAPFPSGKGPDTALDRTMKMYIGGKQARPDAGYSYPVLDSKGRAVSEAGLGNRKDVRNAVEAAKAASGWSSMTGHSRAQVLYFLAENLEARAGEFVDRILSLCGGGRANAQKEVDVSISRIIHYAAWADKYDGDVRAPATNMLSLMLNEPWDVLGISCPDDLPLLGLVSLVMPAIAMGNRVVVTPSQSHPLVAGDFYQVLDTSDVPAGVINIITGDRDELAEVMAKHDDIACQWYFGSQQGSTTVERESAGNLKATWVNNGKARDWYNPKQAQGREFLFHAVQKKTIWKIGRAHV